MAQGSSTLLEVWLLPKPCITIQAGRRSPGLTPSGIRTVPASLRPFETNVPLVSAILFTYPGFQATRRCRTKTTPKVNAAAKLGWPPIHSACPEWHTQSRLLFIPERRASLSAGRIAMSNLVENEIKTAPESRKIWLPGLRSPRCFRGYLTAFDPRCGAARHKPGAYSTPPAQLTG